MSEQVLTADMIHGIVSSLLMKNFDEPSATPPCHMDWWELCCNPHKQIAIAAPREHAKSSAVTVGYGLSSVLVRDHDYVLIVSDTTTQAISFLSNIKQELVENQELISLFKIKGFIKDTEADFIMQMEDGHQFRMSARGAEQSLRGLLWRKRRPNLILCDDMESDEQVMNDDRRKKFREWFFSALIPSMARKGKIRVVGTILHMDSLLERLMPKLNSTQTIEEPLVSYHKEPEKHSWLAYRYRAHNDDFSQLLWKERLSKEYFQSRKRDFIEQGIPEKYNQEYLNNPIDDATAYFNKELFHDISNRDEYLVHYVACDLAISERKGAAFTAMVVVGVNHSGKLKVLDMRRFRGDAYDIINELFSLNMEYGPECIFIEEENIARSLGAVIDKEMIERDTFLNIETLRPSADKIQRARGFQARMRAGIVEWDKDADWYEGAFHELVSFPRSKYKDQVDALSLIGLGLDSVHAAKSDKDRAEEDWERLEQEVASANIDKWTGY